jgi:hypothetical protein
VIGAEDVARAVDQIDVVRLAHLSQENAVSGSRIPRLVHRAGGRYGIALMRRLAT